MAKEKNTTKSNLPVFLEVRGVVSMESIDMYICISAMKAVWGVVSRIYWRILRKSETKPRADMFTQACSRKR